VAGRYAVRLNGLNALALTKLDVLCGFERIGIVTGYRVRGQAAGFSAAGSPELEVVVEELEGWEQPIGGIRTKAALPQATRHYIARIEEELATPVELISVGRERNELVR
jgi:adenylosuccinate synthase